MRMARSSSSGRHMAPHPNDHRNEKNYSQADVNFQQQINQFINFKLILNSSAPRATKRHYIDTMEWKFPTREHHYVIQRKDSANIPRPSKRPPALAASLGSQLNARDFIAQEGTPDEVFVRDESHSDERTENIDSPRTNQDESNLIYSRKHKIKPRSMCNAN